MVHDNVDQNLELLGPVFSKVLMLIVQLALPIINSVSMQDLLDLVADFNLGAVADELSWGSPHLDLIFQGVELLISFNGINISYKGLNSNKCLGNGSAKVNSWSIQIDGIHGN